MKMKKTKKEKPNKVEKLKQAKESPEFKVGSNDRAKGKSSNKTKFGY